MASTRQCSGSNFWLVDRALLRLRRSVAGSIDHLVPIEPDPPRQGQASGDAGGRGQVALSHQPNMSASPPAGSSATCGA